MLLNNTAAVYPTDRCFVYAPDKCIIVDESELSWSVGDRQIKKNSMSYIYTVGNAVGIRLKSHKTGKITSWIFSHVDLGDENSDGEINRMVFMAADHYSQPEVQGWKLYVNND